MNAIVIYHANCPDGFCAAWVASSRLGEEGAEYIPAHYGTDPPDVTGRDVYILDFSYKAPVLSHMIAQCQSMVVLDHHKTAQAELAPLVERHSEGHGNVLVRFDMEKSGGRLAWEHFCGAQEPPWLVDYTEDRDLWRWKLDWSREISAFMASYPRTFDRWSDWATTGPGSGKWDTFVDQGSAIIRYQDTIVDAAVANATEIDMDGHKILAVNSTVLFSEVAGKLAEDRPFGAAWFIRADGKRQWSLRSRDGGIDVSEIARGHGGGGHRNAAGFEDII